MRFRTVIFVVASIAGMQSASAGSLVVDVTANGSRVFETIYPANTETASLSRSSTASTSTATFGAYGTARSSPGSIGVQATAEANGTTSGRQEVSASAQSSHQDSVSFSGATQVRLNAEVLFDFVSNFIPTAPGMGGSGSASGFNWFFSQIEYTWFDTAWRSQKFVICNGGANCDRNYTASAPGLYAFQQDIFVAAGTQLFINNVMNAVAGTLLYNSVTGQLNGGTAYASTSALNSLRNGVTVLTPGVTLSSQSGHNYVFQPHAVGVPEPGTLALLGLGLAGLGLSRRRKA